MTKKLQINEYAVPYSAYSSWSRICPENRYCVVAADQTPPGLPPNLLSKTVQVVVMASGDNPNNRTVYVVNPIRYDQRGGAFDQEPLVVVFNHETETTTGAFIHHGGWDTRTVKETPEIIVALENSGLTAHFPYLGIPTQPSGDLRDLQAHPQGYAFWNAVKEFGA